MSRSNMRDSDPSGAAGQRMGFDEQSSSWPNSDSDPSGAAGQRMGFDEQSSSGPNSDSDPRGAAWQLRTRFQVGPPLPAAHTDMQKVLKIFRPIYITNFLDSK